MVIVPVIDLMGLTNYMNKNNSAFFENPTGFLYFLQIDSTGYITRVFKPTEAGLSDRNYYKSATANNPKKRDVIPEDEGLEELKEDGMFQILGDMEIQALCHIPLWGASYDFEEEAEATCLTGDIILDILVQRPGAEVPLKYDVRPYVSVLTNEGRNRIDISDMVGEMSAGVFVGLLYENGAFQGDTQEEIKRNLDFLINF